MRIIHAIATVLTALALVPGGTHLFELRSKLGLDSEQYFVVQQIYRGWALFGLVIIAAFVANATLAVLQWKRREPFGVAVAACVAIVCSLGVFFAWVYPANVATGNWTKIPSNWQDLRVQWEYGHMAGAILTFFALCLVAFARGDPKRRICERVPRGCPD
jgi:hypothetical protein